MGQRWVQSNPTTPGKFICTDVRPPNMIQCFEDKVYVHNVWVNICMGAVKEGTKNWEIRRDSGGQPFSNMRGSTSFAS